MREKRRRRRRSSSRITKKKRRTKKNEARTCVFKCLQREVGGEFQSRRARDEGCRRSARYRLLASTCSPPTSHCAPLLSHLPLAPESRSHLPAFLQLLDLPPGARSKGGADGAEQSTTTGPGSQLGGPWKADSSWVQQVLLSVEDV